MEWKKTYERKTYVLTEYSLIPKRKPSILLCNTKEEADQFIKTCTKWGLHIASCKVIPNKKAKEMIINNEVDI